MFKIKNITVYGPGYFKGATQLYAENKLRENVNPHPKQSKRVINKLKEELKIDLELYNFILQRFYTQLQYVRRV